MSYEDLEKNLFVQQECYICFDMCATQSPCRCTSFVHKQCLKKYIDTRKKHQCTVCLAEFPTVQYRFGKWRPSALYCVVNIIAFAIQWGWTYDWIRSPIVLVTFVSTTLALTGGRLLQHYFINHCLVYKEQNVHKCFGF